MKKIVLLTDGIFPFVLGGMQKHSYYSAKYFARDEIFTDVYHFIPNDKKHLKLKDFFSEKELNFLNFYEIEFPKSIYFPGHYLYNSYIFSKNIFDILIKNLKNVKLIYAQGFSAWYLLKNKTKINNSIKIAVNFHGLEMFQKTVNFKNLFENHLLKKPVLYNLNRSDFAISLGGKLTNILYKNTKYKEKIKEISIGIEKKWLFNGEIKNNKIRKFVFIGRYEKRKGIPQLQNILKNIEKDLKYSFEFIGAIPENIRLKDEKIIYHGVILEENKIMHILQNADFIVVPSFSEGMPTVILEAMSCACAVIATDVGAVNCLVNEKTGWLIEAVNLKQLEKSIIQAISISDNELLEKKKNALSLIKEKFLLEKVIEKTLKELRFND